MWFIIVYFLNPYILKVSTIQMGRGVKSDSVSGLKNLVYPDEFGFFLAFIATIPVLLLIFAYAKRKPGASELVQKLWRNGRNLLTLAAIINMIVVFIPYLANLSHSINIYGWGQLAVAAAILTYLYASRRVTDTFADFPEETAAEKNNK
jgi:hypothetical protein